MFKYIRKIIYIQIRNQKNLMISMKKNQLLIIIILVVVLIISLFVVSFIPYFIAGEYELSTSGGTSIVNYLTSNVFYTQFIFNIVLVILIVILFLIILYLLRESERALKSVNAQ